MHQTLLYVLLAELIILMLLVVYDAAARGAMRAAYGPIPRTAKPSSASAAASLARSAL